MGCLSVHIAVVLNLQQYLFSIGEKSMEKKVTKKSGYNELFIKEKIVTSAVKAGAPVDIARDIANEVEEQSETDLKTKWIRRYVLDKLKHHSKAWHDNWVNYDKRMKRFYEHDY